MENRAKAALIGFVLIVCATVGAYLYFVRGTTDKSYLTYEFDNCLYFDALSDEDKDIYRMFYDLAVHKDEKGYARTVMMDRFEYAAKEDVYLNIYHAMIQDHPELFFLDGTNERELHVRGIRTALGAILSFRLGPGRADENEMIARFERAADDFMKDIDLTQPADQVELQIHDKLIDTVSYDHELAQKDILESDLGHTAYGALVADDNGQKNKAVCDGYAKAFQYLLQRAGIRAAYVSGEATSEAGALAEQGSHAWNLVMLDDEWYEVDCCWDDIDPPSGAEDDQFYKVIKFEQPQYYYATHHWYNRTTDQMKDLPGNKRASIRIQDKSTIYELEHCKRSSHIRTRSGYSDDYELFTFLNGYLPEAKGMRYALEY